MSESTWEFTPNHGSSGVIGLAAALCVGLLTGCTSIGPQKLLPTHEGYNNAVQLTLTREVLKNIVRERYLDPTQYITVSSINAQFSVSTTATGGVGDAGTASVRTPSSASEQAGQVGGCLEDVVGFSGREPLARCRAGEYADRDYAGGAARLDVDG